MDLGMIRGAITGSATMIFGDLNVDLLRWILR
jgi:hypothetical protein